MAEIVKTEFEAIGTHWSISTRGIGEAGFARVLERVMERIESFDHAYSRFRADSLVTAMSQEAGVYELPEDSRELMNIYLDLYQLTDGAFTPLIGQVLSDAGYDARYSFEQRALTSPPPLDEILSYTFPTLTLQKPALLDFGAAGKGYLVDLVADILSDAGIASYTINAGGDIRVKTAANEEPARVGLENPDDASQVIGVASITDGAICGSAGNRRAWGNYHHIIDPRALESPRHIKALWVTAEAALTADALATALFFVPPSRLSSYRFEYFIVSADNTFQQSSHFPAEIFTNV